MSGDDRHDDDNDEEWTYKDTAEETGVSEEEAKEAMGEADDDYQDSEYSNDE